MEDQDEDLTQFAAVMANIRVERLPQVALSIRDSQSTSRISSESTTADASVPRCTVLDPPLFGSCHVVYILEFAKGVLWALKVPALGHHDAWDESGARALTSEALTMRLLARETTVPLPVMYHYDSSLDNELHCPFILMDFVDGLQCQDC